MAVVNEESMEERQETREAEETFMNEVDDIRHSRDIPRCRTLPL